MAHHSKSKFYVVWEGHRPGIYVTWADAERQVIGFPKAKFKSFSSRDEAETAFRGNYWNFVEKKTPTLKPSLEGLARLGIERNSVAVDAACSGVPGPMEYRGVNVATGEELFHEGPYRDGTNNIGEFLAIVHALDLLQKKGQPHLPIYSDSVNAQLWVRQRVCRTKLLPTAANAPIFELIQRALEWLKHNPVTNPILKWETEIWGEIPADFGRK